MSNARQNYLRGISNITTRPHVHLAELVKLETALSSVKTAIEDIQKMQRRLLQNLTDKELNTLLSEMGEDPVSRTQR